MVKRLNAIRDESIILKRRISKLEERKAELEWSLIPGGIRYDKDKVQTSPEDRMLRVAAEISELQSRINSIMHVITYNALKVKRIIAPYNLNERKTSVATLYFGYAYTVRQIARYLKTNDKTVKQTIYRIRKSIS